MKTKAKVANVPYADYEKDRAYHRLYARRWMKTPKGKAYELVLRGRQMALMARLKQKPCADCQGWFEPCQMDFDHREPSKKSGIIARLIRHSRKSLMAEIAKCDLVCANCHRLRTKKRGATWLSN